MLFVIYYLFISYFLLRLINFIRFKYPLPKDALSNGKHKLIEDPSNQYFGIVLQKKAEFKQKALVVSERSREKKRKEEAESEIKKKLASQLLDDEAQYEYCQKMLKELGEKRKLKDSVNMEIEAVPTLVAIENDLKNLDKEESGHD